jgi:hypothetical protein
MENNQIASIIQESGIASLYGNKSSYPKSNAQQNLSGRTHWAIDENLRFFGCRISSAHETESGLLFYVIESSFMDFNKTKRGFRYAIFDIFGECVSRLDMEDAFKTSAQAKKAMWKQLDEFDTAEHYRKALLSIAKRAEIKAEDAREALSQLTEEATA